MRSQTGFRCQIQEVRHGPSGLSEVRRQPVGDKQIKPAAKPNRADVWPLKARQGRVWLLLQATPSPTVQTGKKSQGGILGQMGQSADPSVVEPNSYPIPWKQPLDHFQHPLAFPVGDGSLAAGTGIQMKRIVARTISNSRLTFVFPCFNRDSLSIILCYTWCGKAP